MNLTWMKAKQTKFTGYVIIYTAVILGILGLANFLAQRYNKSIDTTSNKKFSLADQTQKIVRELKQDVNVTYWDEQAGFQGAKDILDRYSNLSNKLKVQYVDPNKKPTLARAAGVRSMGAITIESGVRKSEAKALTEEEITGAIIRVIKDGQRTICGVSGSGEGKFDDTERTGYSSLKELAERNNYLTRTISLLEKPEIPADCTVVVIPGPRFDYTQPAVDAIRKNVENGGHVLIMLEAPVKLASGEVSENLPLSTMLDGWGVTPQKNLIIDLSGIGQLFGLSEVMPLVSSYGEHAIVNSMKSSSTAFPLSRSLDIRTTPAATVTKLFSTSDNAVATGKLDAANLTIDPKKDKTGPFTIGVAGEVNGEGGKKGRFVAVGSGSWASNGAIRFNGNRDLVMNMLNWLSADEDLISIRPKETQDRRLSLTIAQMRTVFFASVVFLPLLVILLGLRVWWGRR
jgi:ABC-type uncharacterized transport system involved in gliding motility auxiliary subunit